MNTELDQIKSDLARLGERIAALEARSRETIIELPARQIVLRPGERYAGILRGLGGEPDADLFLLPEVAEGKNWNDAMAWAESVGGELPDRREAQLLWTNLQECFESGWHWLREQHAGNSDCAWSQGFEDGHQDWDLKRSKLRCRAVRRTVIQSSSIFRVAA